MLGTCVIIVSTSDQIHDIQYQVLLLQHGCLQLHNLEKYNTEYSLKIY